MINTHPQAHSGEKEELPRRSLPSRRLAVVGLTVVLGLSLLALFPPRLFRDLHIACLDLLALTMPGIVIIEIDEPARQATASGHGREP